eukprot:TRINITY_DN1822_c0_g1_i1.p1 TRINITY_DN1822_c0_g1~~TRINITY_DN1822_c0_g1_i1.p1  ORF type:complete len:692 (-),score=88.60 TRINITY_DN1822_c0_g1_i1:47-2122(-)
MKGFTLALLCFIGVICTSARLLNIPKEYNHKSNHQRYVVHFHDEASDAEKKSVHGLITGNENHIGMIHQYQSGFSAHVPDHVAEKLLTNKAIKHVVKDTVVFNEIEKKEVATEEAQAADTEYNTQGRRYHESALPLLAEDPELGCPPEGLLDVFSHFEDINIRAGHLARHLDLLDQRHDTLDYTYFFNSKTADSMAGDHRIPIYMFSSEVRTTHVDLSHGDTSVSNTFFIPADHQPMEGDSARMPENNFPSVRGPCPGKGTSYASLIASPRFGVLQNSDIRNMVVVDNYGFGYLSWLIDALDAVLEAHAAEFPKGEPGVVFLPYNGPANDVLDCYMDKLTRANLVPVVPAGDKDKNACRSSPARSYPAITVGAIRADKFEKASFSNYGPCVDVYAPGTLITAASPDSDSALSYDLHGTNYAAAIAAGHAVMFLDLIWTVPLVFPSPPFALGVLDMMHVLATSNQLGESIHKSEFDGHVEDAVLFSLPITQDLSSHYSGGCLNIHNPETWTPCEICRCFDGHIPAIGPNIARFEPHTEHEGCYGQALPEGRLPDTVVLTSWLRGESGDFDLHIFSDVPSIHDMTPIKIGEIVHDAPYDYDPHDERPDPTPPPPTPVYAPYCTTDKSEENKSVVENWTAIASACSPGPNEFLEVTVPNNGKKYAYYIDTNEDGKGDYRVCGGFHLPEDFEYPA